MGLFIYIYIYIYIKSHSFCPIFCGLILIISNDPINKISGTFSLFIFFIFFLNVLIAGRIFVGSRNNNDNNTGDIN